MFLIVPIYYVDDTTPAHCIICYNKLRKTGDVNIRCLLREHIAKQWEVLQHDTNYDVRYR